MPIDYDAALALRGVGSFSYTDTQTMLYALGIGMGRDPYDPKELPFVYEGAGLKVVPTIATVLSKASVLYKVGVNMALVLHGEQRMTVHRPLPAAATLEFEQRVVDIIDKGAGKGALVVLENILREADNPNPVVTLGSTIFARGDGGFGAQSARAAPAVHEIPDRAPDIRFDTQTRLDQALLYRLNGDRNPLHADPAVAERAGFKVPILHGLCGYGIACRAVLAAVCDYDPARIGQFDVRFTSPVMPGDMITTDLWIDGDLVSFRCRVEARGITSINNGKCMLRQ